MRQWFGRQALYDVVGEYVQRELPRRQQPLYIHFWDTNHDSPESKRIARDPQLRMHLLKHGEVAYQLESVPSSIPNQTVKNFLEGSKQARGDYLAYLRESVGNAKWDEAFGNNASLLEYAARGGSVYYPDPRPATTEDPAMLAVVNPLFELEENLPEPDCARIINTEEKYRDSLSPEKRMLFDEHQRRDREILALPMGPLDAEISRRIRTHIMGLDNPKNKVVIVEYGAAHYQKSMDLNERLPGLSIAVLERPGTNIADEADGIHFPHYAWYGAEERLVKLDTPTAKAEYLGVSVEKLPDIMAGKREKLPDLPSEVAKACHAAVAHLKPWGEPQAAVSSVSGDNSSLPVKPVNSEKAR